MFSFKLVLKPETFVSKFSNSVGYLTLLSIIGAINCFDNLVKLTLKIKWPNDILTHKLIKIGGTLHDYINDTLLLVVG